MTKTRMIPLVLILMTPVAMADTVTVKDLVYVDSDTAGTVSAYETETFSVRWVTNFSAFLVLDGPLFLGADKNSVFVGLDTATGGSIAALSAVTGGVNWITTLTFPVSAAPTVTKDHVFVGTRGALCALDKITGELLWEVSVGSVDSAPLVDKGAVYVNTSDSGEDLLWKLDVDTGNALIVTRLNPGP